MNKLFVITSMSILSLLFAFDSHAGKPKHEQSPIAQLTEEIDKKLNLGSSITKPKQPAGRPRPDLDILIKPSAPSGQVPSAPTKKYPQGDERSSLKELVKKNPKVFRLIENQPWIDLNKAYTSTKKDEGQAW